jgi:hypothetical protein
MRFLPPAATSPRVRDVRAVGALESESALALELVLALALTLELALELELDIPVFPAAAEPLVASLVSVPVPVSSSKLR